MSFPKNTAGQVVFVGPVTLIADGSNVTSGASVAVKLDAAGSGAGGGTLAYDANLAGWTYAPTQAETNCGSLMISVYKTACLSAAVTVLTDPATVALTSAYDAAKTAAAAGAKMDLVDAPSATAVASIKANLGTIPASGNWATAGAAMTLTTAERQFLAKLKYGCSGTVRFVELTGDDGHDGLTEATALLTPQAAMTASSAGDVVKLGAGTFTAASGTLNCTPGVDLWGAGKYLTVIAGRFNPASNATYRHGGCSAPTAIEINSSYLNNIATNTWFEDWLVLGVNDGFLMGVLDVNSTFGGGFRRCSFATTWDTVACWNGHAAFEFEDCDFLCDNTTHELGGSNFNLFSTVDVKLSIRRCRCISNSSVANGVCANIHSAYTGYPIHISDSVFESNATGVGGTAYMLQDESYIIHTTTRNQQYKVYVANCIYDPAKVSGIVTQAPPLANLDASVAAGNASAATAATQATNANSQATTAASEATAASATASAIATVLSGVTSLAKWLRGLARSDAMDATAKSELNAGGGAYDEATASQQALAAGETAIAGGLASAMGAGFDTGTDSLAALQPQLAAVAAKTGLIGAGMPPVWSPLGIGGRLTITRGNGYTGSRAPHWDVPLANFAGMDLAGATVLLTLVSKPKYDLGQNAAELSFTGTISGSDPVVLTVELPAAQTAPAQYPAPPATVPNYVYDVLVTPAAGGDPFTAAHGPATVTLEIDD